jgi:acid phosphatase family membrane protein YuiD
MLYVLAPFLGWFFSGVTKFLINYLRYGSISMAKSRMGNGGFPSTHASIMSTTTTLIGWEVGIMTPIFGLAIAVTYIVIIDATGLRRHVGYHAEALNKSNQTLNLRESMGHTKAEVAGGIALGMLLGSLLFLVAENLN